MTEQEFLKKLLDKMSMREDEMEMAKAALLDMVTGNPIQAMRTGLAIAEAALHRTRTAIETRIGELDGQS